MIIDYLRGIPLSISLNGEYSSEFGQFFGTLLWNVNLNTLLQFNLEETVQANDCTRPLFSESINKMSNLMKQALVKLRKRQTGCCTVLWLRRSRYKIRVPCKDIGCGLGRKFCSSSHTKLITVRTCMIFYVSRCV